jgi:hypothetical protein
MPELLMTVKSVHVNRTEAVATIDLVATLGDRNPDAAHLSGWPTGRRLSWRGAYRFTLDSDSLIHSIAIYGDETGLRWLPDTGGSTGHERSSSASGSPS